MSCSIEAITISGVRSFDPNPSNAQRITFKKPLTVILGKNGAGKTTIIESLLNACTGAMPPGSGEKVSFVYDPKVIGRSHVKAQIRLDITAKDGSKVSIFRKFESVTKNAQRLSFQTLASDVAVRDPATSELRTTSLPANELDKMVPTFLGVSKSVLENVVFCHQDESNWPLQAPAEVKKRFDDIFASSGYVAALDKLKEVIKKYKAERVEEESNLKDFKMKKEEAAQLRETIAKDRKASNDLQKQSREVEPKLKLIRDALSALNSIDHNAAETDRQIATLDGRIAERGRANKEIANKGVLRNVRPEQMQNPQQSLKELKETRDSFDAQMRQIKVDYKEAEEKLTINRAAERKLQQHVTELTADIEYRQRAERDHKRRVEELKESLRHVSDAFVVGDSNLDEKALLRVERKLQEDLATARQLYESERISADNAVRSATEDLSIIQREFDAYPPQRQHFEEQIVKETRIVNEKTASLNRCIAEGNRIMAATNVPPAVATRFVPASSAPFVAVGGGGGEEHDNADANAHSSNSTTTHNTAGNTHLIQKYFEDTIADFEQRIEEANARRRAGAWHQEEERLSLELNTITALLTRLRGEIAARSEETNDSKKLAILQEQLADQKQRFDAMLSEATSFLQQAQQAQYNAQLAAGRLSPQQQQQGPLLTPANSPLHVVSLAFEHLKKNREVDRTAALDAAQKADRAAAIAFEKLGKKREELATAERTLQQQVSMFKSAQASMSDMLGGGSVEEVCSNFEKILAHVQHQHVEAKQNISTLVAMRDCYASFISTARSDHKCSVCDRELDDNALSTFVHNNEEKHKNAPQQLEMQKQNAARLEKTIGELKRLEAVASTILRHSASIPTLKVEIAQLAIEHDQLTATYNALSQRRIEIETSFNDAQTFVQQNMSALNSKKSEISSLQVQEQAINAKLQKMREQRQQQQQASAIGTIMDGDNTSSLINLSVLSLDDIEKKHASTMDSFNAVTARLQDVRREKLAEERGGMNNDLLKTSLDLHRKELFALNALIRQCADLTEDIRVASISLKKANDQLSNLNTRRAALQQQLDMARANLEKVTQVGRKRVDAAKVQVDTHERSVLTVAKEAAQVKQYLANGEGGMLNTSRDKLAAASHALEQERASIAKLESHIRDCIKTLDNQNQAKNTIEQQFTFFSNLEDARLMQVHKQELESALYKLKADRLQHVANLLGSRYDPSMPVDALKRLLMDQSGILEKDCAFMLGSIATMENTIKQAEERLQREDLEGADRNYMKSFVWLHTTDLVVKDLEKYYTALEKAIQSYHHEKIDQINRLIAEYWRQTYRGSDIDTIEIKAEDEVTASGAVNTRKSYKYRLVTRKGNAEMDMRGRCSAGQKVLASVVIRLALSEAFCCECGILALDEPTTNLDEENSKSLALALKDLISARQNSSNFQLIVITHDEMFVRALGGHHVVDTYYFVHKDRGGDFSVVDELEYRHN